MEACALIRCVGVCVGGFVRVGIDRGGGALMSGMMGSKGQGIDVWGLHWGKQAGAGWERPLATR
jgi:hypothetical protein